MTRTRTLSLGWRRKAAEPAPSVVVTPAAPVTPVVPTGPGMENRRHDPLLAVLHSATGVVEVAPGEVGLINPGRPWTAGAVHGRADHLR